MWYKVDYNNKILALLLNSWKCIPIFHQLNDAQISQKFQRFKEQFLYYLQNSQITQETITAQEGKFIRNFLSKLSAYQRTSTTQEKINQFFPLPEEEMN